MSKLPVFATFGNAVGFTFWNFFTIFRLAWLPFAAMIAAMFVIGYYVVNLLTTGPLGTPMVDPFTIGQHIDQFVFLEITMILLKALVIASVAVSIHRVILFGDRKPGEYFNFAFGKTEFLYLVMGLLTALIVMAIMGALLTPAVYFVAGGDFATFFAQFKDWPNNMKSLVASGALAPLMLAYSVGWLIVVFILLRLAVWPPSVVATGRLSPADAWNLTRGNVWRFIGLFVLVALCAYLVIIPVAVWYFTHFDHGSLPIAAENEQVAREQIRELMQKRMITLAPYAPVLWLCYLLIYVFFTGLSVALISYSYKALKGYDAAAPIPE